MKKTSSGLVDYTVRQIGKPYWFGTYGQTASVLVYANKKNQYPLQYSSYGDCSGDYGMKVHDDIGLIKGYLWCDSAEGKPTYGITPDVTIYGLYENCPKRDTFETMPDIPGVCLFTSSLDHVGIYIGNGEVAEAISHDERIVKNKLDEQKWAYWGMPKWINYETNSIETTSPVDKERYTISCRILRNGSYGADVAALQRKLMSLGYYHGGFDISGEFEESTEMCVKEYQKNHKLIVDGAVGKETMRSLLGIL